jgi:hypothetical protein
VIVNAMFVHSAAVKLILYTVGATLFRVHIHHVHRLPLPWLSLILIYLHVVHGSVIVTLVPFVLTHALAVHHASVYHAYVNVAHVSIALHVRLIAIFSFCGLLYV